MIRTVLAVIFLGVTGLGFAGEVGDCRLLQSSDIAIWEACSTGAGDSYSVSRTSKTDESVLRVTYSRYSSGSGIQIESSAGHSDIEVSVQKDILFLDAVAFDENSRLTSSTTAIPIDALVSPAVTMDGQGSCGYWSSSDLQSSDESPQAAIGLFSSSSAVAETKVQLESLLDMAEREGVRAMIQLPWISSIYDEHGFVSSDVLSFGLMADTLKEEHDLQSFGCIALAFGAIGAIAGVLRDNPAAGVGCAGSCGTGLGCLVSAIQGSALSPVCYGAIGSCMGCVGIGYASNLDNCLRVFFQMN